MTQSCKNNQPFWFRQAMADEPGYQSRQLQQDCQADVCIVGGGFTGLWTAIQLKLQQSDLDVVILDKGLCGSGASGRNGGCMLTWSTKYLSMKRLYGESEAIALVKASEQAVDEIIQFCQRYGIDAELRRDGALYTATNRAQYGVMDPILAALDEQGINSWQAWQEKKVQDHAGSPLHCSGYFSPVAASVQPGKLVRGLKRVAEQLGVMIYENTPMLTLSEHGEHKGGLKGVKPEQQSVRQSGVLIRTPQACIYAKQAVMALNVWMLEHFPEFKNKIMVVSSDMVITRPIPNKLKLLGLKDGKTVLDSRTFVHYYRSTPDGRLMLGKGGNYFPFANAVSNGFDGPSCYMPLLRSAFARLFPSLADEEFEQSWSGASDRSVTGLPFFGRLEPGSHIYYGLGYSGNGVTQTWVGGKILASMLLGREDWWSHNALTRGPKGRFPAEPFRWLGALLVRNAIRRKEAYEDEGRTPFWLDRKLANLANAAGKADK